MLDYVTRGWAVIELHWIRGDGTCSCGQGEKKCPPKNRAKHPRETGWQKARPMDANKARRIWKPENVFQPNIGIATGAPSGFWVLDIDPDSGGAEQVKAMQDDEGHGPLSAGRVVQTGSGGWHLYFTMPDFPVTNSVGRIHKRYGTGIDVRGTGGQVVAPPSRTLKGDYTVLKDEPIGPAPDWLLDLIRPEEKAWTGPTAPAAASTSSPLTGAPASAATSATPATPSPAPRAEAYAANGVRLELARLDDLAAKGWDGAPWDSTCYEVACNLIEIANSDWNGYTVDAAYNAFFARAPRDNEGFDDARVNTKFASAHAMVGDRGRPTPNLTATTDLAYSSDVVRDPILDRLAAGDTTGIPIADPVAAEWPMRTWDDIGNADRIADHYGRILRWVEEAGRWAVFTGARWELQSEPRHLVHDMLTHLGTTEALNYSEFIVEDDEKVAARTAFMKWVKDQRSSGKISAALREAAALPRLQASLEDFDRDPWMLNVANGVVDLRTGILHATDPDLMLMQQVDVIYDPGALSPLWDKFLERTQPSPFMRQYLQRCSGYSMTGLTIEQSMFLHHGSGANGKSVYLRAMTLIAGSYGQTVPRSTLLIKPGGDSHPTDVARMQGKRFLQVSETAAGRRLDEETVKGLTGGEKQTARFMGKDFFDFTPTGKIHYVTNHLPRLSDAESIWRRLHLIGWRVTIPEQEIDPMLGDKLEAEAQGILAWAVRGAVEWFQHRLQVPDESRADLAEYRRDQDEFGEFLASRLVADRDAVTSVSDLYLAYQSWAFASGIRRTLTALDFGKVLVERGYERAHLGAARGIRGLAVAVTENAPQSAGGWFG